MANILMLSSRIPYPLTSGYSLRICGIGKIAAKYHQVDLLAIHEKIDDKALDGLKRIFHSATIIPKKKSQCVTRMAYATFSGKPLQVEGWFFPDVQRLIEKTAEKYDLIYCNHIRMAEYLNTLSRPVLIDLHDALSLHYQRGLPFAQGFWRLLYSFEKERVKKYEISLLEKWNNFLITSQVDASYLTSQALNKKNISIIPQGVREDLLRGQKRDIENGQNIILFVGKMDYYPNEDAVIFFANEVFPSIKRKKPDAQFVIAGIYPTKRVQKLAKIEGVKIAGYVHDLHSCLEQAKVVVAPIRFGAGIQNKVLEAMALRKAVVATPVAVGGINGVHGQHYLVAKNPEQMEEYIVELFDEPLKRKSLGEQGCLLVEKHYTWKALEDKIATVIDYALTTKNNDINDDFAREKQ